MQLAFNFHKGIMIKWIKTRPLKNTINVEAGHVVVGRTDPGNARLQQSRALSNETLKTDCRALELRQQTQMNTLVEHNIWSLIGGFETLWTLCMLNWWAVRRRGV